MSAKFIALFLFIPTLVSATCLFENKEIKIYSETFKCKRFEHSKETDCQTISMNLKKLKNAKIRSTIVFTNKNIKEHCFTQKNLNNKLKGRWILESPEKNYQAAIECGENKIVLFQKEKLLQDCLL